MSETNPAPETKPQPVKTPKTKPAKSSAASGTEPPLINPDWAAYIIKKEDIIGQTAKLAVDVLTAVIEKEVKKATKPEKLEKIVWSAITEARRKVRG